MKLKKFTAPTTREALQKLRAEMGEDAIILSTKQTAAGTEVLAASTEDLDQVTSQPAQVSSPAQWTRTEREQYAVQKRQEQAVTDMAKPVAQPAPAPFAKPQPAPSRIAEQVQAQRAAILTPPQDDMLNAVAARRQAAASQAMEQEQAAVLNELKQMRQLLKDQMQMIGWRDSLEKNPQRAELWSQLSQAGFSPLFARTVVEKLPAGLSESQMQDWLSQVLRRNLKLVPANQDVVETGGLYALVGPTGVGKTTTTAKLAARCVVKYGADSLGLITTDSYRIGAQDQLRIYGKILGVQVYTAQTHADLQQLRATMQRKRLILIDTVGMGQRDARLAEQTKILNDSHVKRILLLNTTSQAETLDDVVRRYKDQGLHGAILSKLDEAVKIGGVLDVVMRHKLALHYMATGQRVPEDLFPADPKVLIHRALKATASPAFDASAEEMKWKMAHVPATAQ